MFLHERLQPSAYGALQSHISGEALRRGNESPAQAAAAAAARLSSSGNRGVDVLVTKVGHIGDANDYRLAMLRHWSLYEALEHSSYVASRLETWTLMGQERLRSLLTQLGIKT